MLRWLIVEFSSNLRNVSLGGRLEVYFWHDNLYIGRVALVFEMEKRDPDGQREQVQKGERDGE